MNYLLSILLLFLGGCSIWDAAPPTGAVIGGAVGAATGNPLVGGAGALAGYSAGKVAQISAKHKGTIKALSEGDIEALVAAGLGEQKGFMDEALDTLYGFIKICLVGVVLWNLVPIIYTRYCLRKHANGKDDGDSEKIKS